MAENVILRGEHSPQQVALLLFEWVAIAEGKQLNVQGIGDSNGYAKHTQCALESVRDHLVF